MTGRDDNGAGFSQPMTVARGLLLALLFIIAAPVLLAIFVARLVAR